ncbi:synaptonemal complex protein 2 isoform X2 [Synchiropus splendidus]|uniref:synaptonemal complex protein 2 isoform X2 n=1 Tax=Synchiropus splendidus TaxID=270530 RepID=UPI00237D342E|nr:synaptonemal complex protein 2 isoform X2 [Synchiropus splendidus]
MHSGTSGIIKKSPSQINLENSFSMAVRQDTQLEKVIEDVLKSGRLEELDGHLQNIFSDAKPVECSKNFVSKLDKLMRMALDRYDYKAATVCLNIIGEHGKHLHITGCGPGLSGIITQGLVKKMVQWFEKCRNLWINSGPCWNETMLCLCEDFSDTLLEVHGACDEGTSEVTESFLYLLGHLAVDTRIHILIRKYVLRKFNIILDKIPAALKKKKISSWEEASDIMLKLAAQMLDCGDYDFQTAQTESLCRMTSPNHRKELADEWFSIGHVAAAFMKIRNSEFEIDCRKFLNLVNGMQGDRRRVYSYPCLKTFLDHHELLMPEDDNLEEFWIDFNVGSRSISFYFSLAQSGQWDTFTVIENEVESYTVYEKGQRKVLQIRLSVVVHLGSVEGSSLSIHFCSTLDIQQAVCRVFGENKRKSFIAQNKSVVKTDICIQMVEDGSQTVAVVPESPMSHGESQNNSSPYRLDRTQLNTSEQCNASQQSLINTGDKYKTNVPVQMGRAELLTQHSQDCVIRDTQPNTGKNTSMRCRRQSISETISKPTQKMSSLPTLDFASASTNSITMEAEKQANESLQKQTRDCKSKEKNQTHAVAGNMVKIISKKQKAVSPLPATRPVSNTTWLSTFKVSEQCGRRSINKSRESFAKERDDVFTFKSEGRRTSVSNSMALPNSDRHKKGPQPKKNINKNLKGHLFSSSNTDHSLDVRWLKEPNKKQCVATYSRKLPIKSASHITADPQDRPQVSPKLETADSKKPAQQPNKRVKSAAAVETQHNTSRRPQRAAASCIKNYRETDTDDSQSASECSVDEETFRFSRRRKTKKPISPSSPPETVMDSPVSKKYCVDQPMNGVKNWEGERREWTLDSRKQSDSESCQKTLYSNEDMTQLQSLESGPCPGLFTSSDSEAEEIQESKFKSEGQVVSAGVDGEDDGYSFQGDVDVSDVSVKPQNLFQQPNLETKKLQMMELYHQQSLKIVQQHVSSISMLIHKDRIQRLDEFRQILQGEIQNLEENDLTLKTMEKDLNTYLKTQSTSFRSYNEREKKSNETLKTVLQGAMCQALQGEERIFTTQMGLLKKEMKSIQDRLMIEMEQEQIKSIKQDLYASIFSESEM